MKGTRGMKSTRTFALAAMLVAPGLCFGARYAIVRPADASLPHAFAAEELQLHLKLALGEEVPIADAAPEGAAVFEPAMADMINDSLLGLSVITLALVIWTVVLLVSDPKGVLRAVLLKKAA